MIKTWENRYNEGGCSFEAAMQAEIDDLRAALQERDAEIERLRVQLAGCGVAALGNTGASKLQRVKPEDYGYSESYAAVCRAVDREIEQRKVLEQALEVLDGVEALLSSMDVTHLIVYGEVEKAIAAIQELK